MATKPYQQHHRRTPPKCQPKTSTTSPSLSFPFGYVLGLVFPCKACKLIVREGVRAGSAATLRAWHAAPSHTRALQFGHHVVILQPRSRAQHEACPCAHHAPTAAPGDRINQNPHTHTHRRRRQVAESLREHSATPRRRQAIPKMWVAHHHRRVTNAQGRRRPSGTGHAAPPAGEAARPHHDLPPISATPSGGIVNNLSTDSFPEFIEWLHSFQYHVSNIVCSGVRLEFRR